MKRLTILGLILLPAFVLSCSNFGSFAQQGANSPATAVTPGPKKAETVNVPRNVKNSSPDGNSLKASSCVLKMLNGTDISLGDIKLTKDALGKEVGACLGRQPSAERIVYIKADEALEYGNLLDIILVTRKVEGDRLRFIVSSTDNTDNPKDILEAKVPNEEYEKDFKVVKPNPNFLLAAVDKGGKIRLNMDEHDSLESLAAKLKEVFKQRQRMGVFREGTNEIEQTVFVKAPRSMKYGEVVKIIDAVTGSGANPIGLQLADLPQ